MEAVIPMKKDELPHVGEFVATQNPGPSTIRRISEGMVYLDSNPNQPTPIKDLARSPREDGPRWVLMLQDKP
jgi:hypothetical protein